jgi:hypothetical protein
MDDVAGRCGLGLARGHALALRMVPLPAPPEPVKSGKNGPATKWSCFFHSALRWLDLLQLLPPRLALRQQRFLS